MIHELKTWPEFWDAVDRGEKTFEVRKDDRGFQVGDVLALQRWQPLEETPSMNGTYTDRYGVHLNWVDRAKGEIRVSVTYKMPGGRFGIDPAFCVLGFKKVEAGA